MKLNDVISSLLWSVADDLGAYGGYIHSYLNDYFRLKTCFSLKLLNSSRFISE